MGREEMRAADADREAVADRLRIALNEGRIDLAEFDERLGRAYGAKTYGELDGLLTDLPGVTPAERQGLAVAPGSGVPVQGGLRYPGATQRWLVENWTPYLSVVGLTVFIWGVPPLIGGGDLSYFWPFWVAGPWGVILLISTLTGLANGEPQRWAAKQERKRRKKAAKDDSDE
ncbi:DUF1707 domain-containing protein [Catenuloplanes sp. NPDC051500]|uniref:DUF1707 domain-containing protein n=1 Tax=Catenuloplanes sp. NPDC051500 TaxID=3363959 RepID=UPI00378F98E5